MKKIIKGIFKWGFIILLAILLWNISPILIFVIVPIISFVSYAKRFNNPYKLVQVIGKKGSGKSTLSAKLSIRYRKRGWNVFSDTPISGCVLYDVNELGVYHFPPKSVLFVDEAGLTYNNRNFKSFPPHLVEFFKKQRKYRLKIYLLSQSYDVDKKIRDLVDYVYLATGFANIFSYAVRYNRRVVCHESTGQSESRFADDFVKDSIFTCFFGSRKLTFIPRYIKYFTSFDAPVLPNVDPPRSDCVMPPRSRSRLRLRKRKHGFLSRWLYRAIRRRK